MKNKNNTTMSEISKSNYKTVESGKIDTPKKSIHDHLLPWINTDTSIKHRGAKKRLKIPKGKSEYAYQRRKQNTMANRIGTKGQTTIYKTYI
jgi:hypothetical protein